MKTGSLDPVSSNTTRTVSSKEKREEIAKIHLELIFFNENSFASVKRAIGLRKKAC